MTDIDVIVTTKKAFNPIEVTIKFSLDSFGEVVSFKNEFITGALENIETRHSEKLQTLLNELKNLNV